MKKLLILTLIASASFNSFALGTTGITRRGSVIKAIGIIFAIGATENGTKNAAYYAREDNVELNFGMVNHSSRTIYYDRNDWTGWSSDKDNNGCTNCKGSILPGQSAYASTGSNKKGASIGWNIGYNPDFSIDKLTYARVWKQSNKNGGLDVQSGNTPYNMSYTKYASEDSNSKDYLLIGNDVPTAVTIAPISCSYENTSKVATKEICNTELSVYDAIENIPSAAKTYTADGTNNVEILTNSDFELKPGEAIRVQAGTSSSKYGNKYKAYELLNLSTDDSTAKLKFMGCYDALCSTTGNTLWEKGSDVSQLNEDSIPAGTYKFVLQNDGNMVDYDVAGNALIALW